MSKVGQGTVKKVGLLNEAENRRSPSQSSAKPKTLTGVPSTEPQSKRQSNQTPRAAYRKDTPSVFSGAKKMLSAAVKTTAQTLAGIVVIALIAVMLLPTPKLVEYDISGETMKNVYWGGFNGYSNSKGRLLDSHYVAYLDEDRKEISICSPYEKINYNNSCQVYQFKSVKGAFPAFYYLAKHYRQDIVFPGDREGES